MHDYLCSVVLGIVEGLTEFLPVSSTAHIRIAQAMMHIDLKDEYWKMYAVVIQLGAILSVLVYFRPRIVEFLKTFPAGKSGDRTILTHPATLILLAFVITAIPAKLLDKVIGDNLEKEWVIGCALLIGGVVMWAIDVWAGRREAAERARLGAPQLGRAPIENAPQTAGKGFEAAPGNAPDRSGPITWTIDAVRPLQAIVIGAAQILSAAFPGTSRSMSTIASGQVVGLSRPAALEFSFFLSIPIMIVATGYKLLQTLHKAHKHEIALTMTSQSWVTLIIGLVVSFIVALLVIHWFMAWVRNRGFVPFAIYRIVAGAALLTWVAAGH